MLKRKAMIKSRMEKAQGLMLSISAETITSGRSNFPPLLKFQTKTVPKLSVFRKITKPKNRIAMAAKIINFLLMMLRDYRRGKFKFEWNTCVIFQIHDSLYPTDSRRTVRGRIKYHLNSGFFVRLNRFIDALGETVPGHAKWPRDAASDFERCHSAHAGSVELIDGKRIGAGIFYHECF